MSLNLDGLLTTGGIDGTPGGSFPETHHRSVNVFLGTLQSGKVLCKIQGLTDYGNVWHHSLYGHWLVREAVVDPEVMLQQLSEFVISLNINQGISNSFDAKLSSAIQSLDDLNKNNDVTAINSLNAFINAVEAQKGNAISEAEADDLISKAQAVIDLLSH